MDLRTREVVLEEELPYGIGSVAWTKDGRRMAVGSESGHLYVLDANDLEPVVPERLVTGGFVNDVEISPDGQIAATIGSDGDVTIWDTGTWRPYGLPVIDEDLGNGFLSFDAESTTLSIDFEVGRYAEIDVRPSAWVAAACAAAHGSSPRTRSRSSTPVGSPGRPVQAEPGSPDSMLQASRRPPRDRTATAPRPPRDRRATALRQRAVAGGAVAHRHV